MKWERKFKAIISIHAPREGSDEAFQRAAMMGHGISIHAPREGSDESIGYSEDWSSISIHAPREGSDIRRRILGPQQAISIHAPREGSDMWRTYMHLDYNPFLSTLPARGATWRLTREAVPGILFLSTLPARGATTAWAACPHRADISIHAPREGSDHRRGGLSP